MGKTGDALRGYDPGLVLLKLEPGAVLLSPSLSGRIFCEFDGELVHRLDRERLENPSPSEFNNLGGNSLWPAPEGGPFAFNYPPGAGDWYVQDGVAGLPARVTEEEPHRAVMEKAAALVNRRGTLVRLLFTREVFARNLKGELDGFGLRGFAYRSIDTIVPVTPVRTEDALVAAWSLEQFPGADGVVAFGKVREPGEAVNLDYYGEPGDRIRSHEGGFTFHLGGTDRHQIGIKVASKPELLGALDLNRSMLFLRKTGRQPGTYFNIADNDQPDGPYSAADLFSIFNGGELGFFELETVGSMREEEGMLGTSILESETVILSGELSELGRYLDEREGVGFVLESAG
jgi:hypothetical protein